MCVYEQPVVVMLAACCLACDHVNILIWNLPNAQQRDIESTFKLESVRVVRGVSSSDWLSGSSCFEERCILRGASRITQYESANTTVIKSPYQTLWGEEVIRTASALPRHNVLFKILEKEFNNLTTFLEDTNDRASMAIKRPSLGSINPI